MREYCGIFGIYSKKREIAPIIKKGLYHLQHRGQESAGIVIFDGKTYNTLKNFGLVLDALPDEKIEKLKGFVGIGHTRYSTAGDKDSFNNIQPIHLFAHRRHLALSHNGNLTNANTLKKALIKKGHIFHSTSDSEVILHLYAKYMNLSEKERFRLISKKVEGAYSILVLENDTLFAFRDKHGTRPLLMGENKKEVAFSSEEGALRATGFKNIRELMPGELVVVKENEISSYIIESSDKKNQCIFELIYFARPDGTIFGKSVYQFRKESGKLLARKEKFDIDIVIPVPDSGVIPALGYSEENGIPLEFGFIRNHYVGRSFIAPSHRGEKVKMKLIPVRNVINGKKIALIDDSIVRGTTSGQIIKLLKENGAREVHMRIASPPVKFPCYFGVDIPTKEELIANGRDIEDIRREIGADSLIYLKMDDLYTLVTPEERNFCYSCFIGGHIYKPDVLNNFE